jgi:hypothetical protein
MRPSRARNGPGRPRQVRPARGRHVRSWGRWLTALAEGSGPAARALRDWWTGRGVETDHIGDADLVSGSLDGSIDPNTRMGRSTSTRSCAAPARRPSNSRRRSSPPPRPSASRGGPGAHAAQRWGRTSSRARRRSAPRWRGRHDRPLLRAAAAAARRSRPCADHRRAGGQHPRRRPGRDRRRRAQARGRRRRPGAGAHGGRE